VLMMMVMLVMMLMLLVVMVVLIMVMVMVMMLVMRLVRDLLEHLGNQIAAALHGREQLLAGQILPRSRDDARVLVQAAQHGGQPVSAADGRDARLPAVRLIEPDLFCKIRHSNHLLPISRWLSVAA